MINREGTHQDLLQGVDGLVGDGQPVDLPDLVADVERGLPVDHAPVHDPCHDTLAVLVHLKRNALREQKQSNK